MTSKRNLRTRIESAESAKSRSKRPPLDDVAPRIREDVAVLRGELVNVDREDYETTESYARTLRDALVRGFDSAGGTR